MFLQVTAIPTGGVIGVSFATAASGMISLSRATSGSGGISAFTNLYSGSPLSVTGEKCYWLDIGDQLPSPLLANTLYVYQLTDNTGSQQSGPVQPVSSIVLETTPWTRIIIAIIQGAVNAAVLPTGIKPPRVFNAMPLSGNPPLPLIAVNSELHVQAAIPIGVDDPTIGDFIQPAVSNNWTQAGQERCMFRITVAALSPEERDFWRTFIIGVLRVATAYALSQIGADFTRDYEASSYQETNETKLQQPGWYAADILWDVTLEANVQILTNFGEINTITASVSGTIENLQFAVGSTPYDADNMQPALTEVQVPIVSGIA